MEAIWIFYEKTSGKSGFCTLNVLGIWLTAVKRAGLKDALTGARRETVAPNHLLRGQLHFSQKTARKAWRRSRLNEDFYQNSLKFPAQGGVSAEALALAEGSAQADVYQGTALAGVQFNPGFQQAA